jgi:hypothetical protein
MSHAKLFLLLAFTGVAIFIASRMGRDHAEESPGIVLRYGENGQVLPESDRPYNTVLTIEMDSKASIHTLMRICDGAGEMGFYAYKIVLTENGGKGSDRGFFIYARTHPKMGVYEVLTSEQIDRGRAEFEDADRDEADGEVADITDDSEGDGVLFQTITKKTKCVDPKKNLLFFYDYFVTLDEYLQMRRRLGVADEAPLWHISEYQ